jgi:soluble lytic murein transglycosylase
VVRVRLLLAGLVLLLGGLAVPALSDRLSIWQEQRENRRVIREAAVALGLPPDLLTAVARQESHFRTHARSDKGAVGILQVMPATGREVAGRLRLKAWSLDDPRDNARIGGTYLKELLARYGGDASLALAAYHAGPGRVDAWVAQGGILLTGPEVVAQRAFPETRRYVHEVLEGLEAWR